MTTNKWIMSFMDQFRPLFFIGVFPIDLVPSELVPGTTLIINTSPSYIPVGHFVALLIRADDILLFDSLALDRLPAPFERVLSRLAKGRLVRRLPARKIQADNSDMCAVFALDFVLSVESGYSVSKVWDSADLSRNTRLAFERCLVAIRFLSTREEQSNK